MKLLTFKEAQVSEAKKYSMLFINDDNVKIKVDTEYLPDRIVNRWHAIQEVFSKLEYEREYKKISNLIGFNIRLGEPEYIIFETEFAFGGLEYKGKSQAVNVDLMYNGADFYSRMFIDFYDNIKVDFADLIVENLDIITKWNGGQTALDFDRVEKTSNLKVV